MCGTSNQVPTSQVPSPIALGEIEIGPGDSHRLHNPPAITVSQYTWTPKREVFGLIADGYNLKMACLTDRQGFRRFIPYVSGAGPFIVNAAAGGMAVVERHLRSKDLSVHDRAAQLNHYRIRQLIYQWSFSRKRNLQREILRIEDLSLHANERPDSSVLTILPECLTIPDSETEKSEESHQRALKTFLEGGQQAAESLGINNLSEPDLIRFCILAQARLDPVQINECSDASNIRRIRLVRQSLVSDLEYNPDKLAQVKQTVEESLWAAYVKHDGLDSAGFRKWFHQDVDNLVQSIAQRLKTASRHRVKSGSQFDNSSPEIRRQVHKSIAELIWEAQQTTSQLVRQMMRQFQFALIPRLTDDELIAFNALYDEHCWSGNLVPLMYHSHFKLLKPLMYELQQPSCSDQTRAAFVNAIFLKTSMIKTRRECDVRRKNSTVGDQAQFRRLKACAGGETVEDQYSNDDASDGNDRQ